MAFSSLQNANPFFLPLLFAIILWATRWYFTKRPGLLRRPFLKLLVHPGRPRTVRRWCDDVLSDLLLIKSLCLQILVALTLVAAVGFVTFEVNGCLCVASFTRVRDDVAHHVVF